MTSAGTMFTDLFAPTHPHALPDDAPATVSAVTTPVLITSGTRRAICERTMAHLASHDIVPAVFGNRPDEPVAIGMCGVNASRAFRYAMERAPTSPVLLFEDDVVLHPMFTTMVPRLAATGELITLYIPSFVGRTDDLFTYMQYPRDLWDAIRLGTPAPFALFELGLPEEHWGGQCYLIPPAICRRIIAMDINVWDAIALDGAMKLLICDGEVIMLGTYPSLIQHDHTVATTVAHNAHMPRRAGTPRTPPHRSATFDLPISSW